MIETPARITRTEGDTAWVVSAAPSSCGACGGKGCGSSTFARILHPHEPEYRVDNQFGAQPGEAVVVGLPDGALFRAALASYLIPLLLLVLVAAIGQYFAGELGAVLGGLFGLVLAGWNLRRSRAATIQPVVLRHGSSSCANH